MLSAPPPISNVKHKVTLLCVYDKVNASYEGLRRSASARKSAQWTGVGGPGHFHTASTSVRVTSPVGDALRHRIYSYTAVEAVAAGWLRVSQCAGAGASICAAGFDSQIGSKKFIRLVWGLDSVARTAPSRTRRAMGMTGRAHRGAGALWARAGAAIAGPACDGHARARPSQIWCMTNAFRRAVSRRVATSHILRRCKDVSIVGQGSIIIANS